MLPRGVTVGLTVLISLVWAGNVVVGFVDPASRDPFVNAIFAVVVGAIYALGRNDSTALRDARRRLGEAIAGSGPDEEESDDAEDKP